MSNFMPDRDRAVQSTKLCTVIHWHMCSDFRRGAIRNVFPISCCKTYKFCTKNVICANFLFSRPYTNKLKIWRKLGKLHQCATMGLDKDLRKMATDLEYTRLLARISGGDLVAIEAKYHYNCLSL